MNQNKRTPASGRKSSLPAKRTAPASGRGAAAGSKKPQGKGTEAAHGVGSTLSRYLGKIVTYALNILLTVFLIGIITGGVVAVALVVYIKNYVDPVYDIENLKFNSSLTTTLYYQTTAEDGSVTWTEWEEESIHGSENRTWVSYEEMPEDLINAFVSIEDKRFFVHKGVDTHRTFGAVLGFFLKGDSSYGGSTITQQLIKNVSGEDDVTIQRKVQEILRAFNLESKRSKTEILEMYLNTIYLSKGCYGVASAAKEFFGKEVKDLTLVECAALAAIPQNPSRWSPVTHPENNAERRWVVLDQMLKNDNIDKRYTKEEIDAAKEADLVLADGATEEVTAVVHSWFVDTLIYDVIEDLQTTYNYDEQMAKNMVYSGGLKIMTTVDRDIQAVLDDVYQNDANFPSQGTGVQVESAMTIIDQSTGHVVGIVGGRGVKTTPLGFNRATQAARQPGSSIKPLGVYVQALDRGLINYSTVFDDSPFRIEGGGKTWPNNWNNVYDGLTTVADGVRHSKNTVAVKTLNLLGTSNSFDFMVNKFHFSTLVKSDMDYAPLALGGFTNGVTTRDMCAAYASIANSGVYNRPRTYVKVLDSTDNVILENTGNPEVILSEDSCAVMTRLMQDVVTSGTGTPVSLRRKMDVAGKTGTTNDNNDLYFCGYTPYYTATCWVGYDIPKALLNFKQGQTRVSPAMYLWDTVMTRIHEKYIAAGGLRRFSDHLTRNLVTRSFCKDSGLLVGDNCKMDPRGNRTQTGYYTESNLPAGACDKHVLVNICDDSGHIACPTCPHTHQVALINEQREFSLNVGIADAQYTYVALPDNVKPSLDQSLPYYMNLYSAGSWPGTSKVASPMNAYCAVHDGVPLPTEEAPPEGGDAGGGIT